MNNKPKVEIGFDIDKTLFVTNIPIDSSDEELKSYLNKFAPV